MKLTTSQLRKIIKEEIKQVLDKHSGGMKEGMGEDKPPMPAEMEDAIMRDLQNFQLNELQTDLDTVEKNIEAMPQTQAIQLLQVIIDMKEAGQKIPSNFKLYEVLLKKKLGIELSNEDRNIIAREKMLFQRFLDLAKRKPDSIAAKMQAKKTNKEKDFQTNPELE